MSGPAGDALAARVASALDRLLAPAAPGTGGGPLALAVSGGSDSLALLHLADDWARAGGRGLVVLTVDHGLRAAARGEAAAVARCARALGRPVEVLQVRPAETGNRQAAAREARLAALAARGHALGAAAVALAHTADDQAETVLMRLARGAGVDGLSAMAPERRLPCGMRLLRPLLEVPRATLRDWLVARGIGWIDDPSNADASGDRVQARRALATLAPLGITPEGLNATAGRLARQRVALEAAADALMVAALRRGVAGEILFDAARLVAAPEDTACRVMARAHAALTGAAYPPRGAALARALAFARAVALGGPDAARSGDEALAGGTLLATVAARAGTREEGPWFALCREAAACAPPAPLAEATGSAFTWDRRLALAAPAPVDLAPGARLNALGARGIEGLAAAGAGLDQAATAAAWRCAPRAARRAAPAVEGADGRLLAVFSPVLGWLGPPDATAGMTLPAADDLVARRLSHPLSAA